MEQEEEFIFQMKFASWLVYHFLNKHSVANSYNLAREVGRL